MPSAWPVLEEALVLVAIYVCTYMCSCHIILYYTMYCAICVRHTKAFA